MVAFDLPEWTGRIGCTCWRVASIALPFLCSALAAFGSSSSHHPLSRFSSERLRNCQTLYIFTKSLYTKVVLENYINSFFKINSKYLKNNKYLINYVIIEYNNRVHSRTEPVLVNCSRLRLRGVPALQELRL